MKLIAHRSASNGAHESCVQSMIAAAQIGADLVECDVTRLADGSYIIFHDASLKRLTGDDIPVKNLTLAALRNYLDKHSITIITLDNLIEQYTESVPILLHIKMEKLENDFIKIIKNAKIPIVFGAISVEVTRQLFQHFPTSKILAFMPKSTDYAEFFASGASIIRLWEHWLCDVSPKQIKQECDGAEVWIMANSKENGMRGNEQTLQNCKDIFADGILLDDIKMAVSWRKTTSN